MNFINKLEDLKTKSKENTIIRNNGTLLLEPGKIPKARHMMFKALSQDIIDEFLIDAYKHKVPFQYTKLLGYTNGALLFMHKLKYSKNAKVQFASPYMTIYGIPRTPPFGRPIDEEEPFDVRVEDLARHDDIPCTWLKCGSYKLSYDSGTVTDIFIDTVDSRVYTCMKNDSIILHQWNDLDSCLCELFDSFVDTKIEYEYDKFV